MTTKLSNAHIRAEALADLKVKPNVTAVYATTDSWAVTASGNLTANAAGYLEIHGVDFSPTDKVMIDLEYASTATSLANSTVLRVSLPENIPAGTKDVYIIRSLSGNYTLKTNGITFE